MYNSVSKTLLLLLVTFREPPMDENFAYWSASFQQAGKWFSSSLALGTDNVADIWLTGNPLTCLAIMIVQDVIALPTLTTWWAPNPQFHRIKTWLSCTPCSQSYSSRLDSYVIHGPPSDEIINSGIGHNNYSIAWNPFHLLTRHRTIAWLLETSYCTFQLFSQCVLFVQLERYSYAHSWVNPRLLPL